MGNMSSELTIQSFYPILTSGRLTEKYKSLQNATFIGIDFGTSTTVVSVATFGTKDKPPILKPIELNQKLSDGAVYSSYKIPSVIAWFQERLLVGEGASQLKFKLRNGVNLWHSFKMDLGEDVGCRYPNSELGNGHEKWTILNAIDATQIFFMYLKTQIDKYVRNHSLPSNIQYAVTIPASFEANQRKDLVNCLEINGFMVNKQSLIDEPNAAFLSYVTNSGKDKKLLKIPADYFPYTLVFDFGAGTCDISILELGRDNKGVFSKNVAISQFVKLGGNDIDRLIAIDVLMPQLFEGTNQKVEDFRTREIQNLFIPKLTATAERLKIKLCEIVALQATTKSIKELSEMEEYIKLGTSIEIETRKGILTLNEPKMSFREYAKICSVFTEKDSVLSTKRIEEEAEFISVFKPIKTALKKAKLEPEDIDYLLFVGGSSKDPFIQESVSNFFCDSEILIPNDLQAHVSLGAAVHSLVYNGFGKNIIQPITSEPIMLILKNGTDELVEPIIEAGTIIPSELKVIDNLSPQKEGQEVIELPICVGNRRKILYNVKLFCDDAKGFSISTPVKLEIEINADKMLIIRAAAGERKIMVEPISPFSNREMTSEERIQFKAEKDFNIELERNGGEPLLGPLKMLYEVYNRIGLDLKAAETLELIEEMFPNKSNLHNIGLHYRNAGKTDKAIEFYEKAMKHSPCAATAFNIAMLYENNNDIGQQKYEDYLKIALSLDPHHNPSTYCLGQLYIQDGKKEKGKKLLNEAFSRWQAKFESNQIDPWDYGWFSSCARALGKDDYADLIAENTPTQDLSSFYRSENLTLKKHKSDFRL
jgi:molecular chaperone DnaK